MAYIVALEFETRAKLLSKVAQDPLDIAGCVLEDEVIGRLKKRLLPLEFPILNAVHRRIKGEIHRTHVK